ncbi:hypothetical protein [Saccharopolyspora tripterygii]
MIELVMGLPVGIAIGFLIAFLVFRQRSAQQGYPQAPQPWGQHVPQQQWGQAQQPQQQWGQAQAPQQPYPPQQGYGQFPQQ